MASLTCSPPQNTMRGIIKLIKGQRMQKIMFLNSITVHTMKEYLIVSMTVSSKYKSFIHFCATLVRLNKKYLLHAYLVIMVDVCFRTTEIPLSNKTPIWLPLLFFFLLFQKRTACCLKFKHQFRSELQLFVYAWECVRVCLWVHSLLVLSNQTIRSPARQQKITFWHNGASLMNRL